MANLLGNNIGTNYKGILNLDSTINTPLDTTLRAVTDGEGDPSPLQLSTTQVGITGTVQTGTGSLYNPFRIGYSNSTISVTNLDLFSFGAIANSSGRYSAVLRLGGGSDTALHYIYAGDNSTSSGIILNRADSATGIFAGTGVLIGDSTFAGSGAASARLHVKGDGTNPVQRWQNGAGSDLATLTNAGSLSFFITGTGIDFYGQGIKFLDSIGTIDYSNAGSSTLAYHRFRSPSTPITGNQKVIGIESNFGAAAGNATFRPLSIEYTINNSGAQTGTATGIFLNATETGSGLNGMTHNLMDLQVGGTSQLKVSRIGDTTSNGTFVSLNAYTNFIGNRFQISTGAAANRTLLVAVGEGIIRISDATESAFNRINLGGSTNAFPAIKRNGAAIDFKLADDSGFCNINALGISLLGGNVVLNTAQNLISNNAAGVAGLTVAANGGSSVALDVLGSSTTSNNIQNWKSSGGTILASISGTGALAISNTVTVAAGIASTHKVTMVINGTTYYLLASDV